MRIEYGRLYQAKGQKWSYVVPFKLHEGLPISPNTVECAVLGTNNITLVYEISFYYYFEPASDQYVK